MAVVIRMMRAGAKKRPFYRVVVADSRRQRDGRFVEIVGHYDPIAKPYALKLDKDRILDWIRKGAQPSEQAASLLRMEGMTWGSPSKPRKKADGAAAKKVARAKPRKQTERKAKAKVARAKKREKIAAKAAAPKESKKKKS